MHGLSFISGSTVFGSFWMLFEIQPPPLQYIGPGYWVNLPLSMLRVNNSQWAILIEIHTPCVKISTVDLPQGVYGFQMEQSVYLAHNLIPKLGRLIDYSSVSKMYTFIHITVIFQMLQWSINYTNSGLTLSVTAKFNESKQIMLVFFTSHFDFARLGRFY